MDMTEAEQRLIDVAVLMAQELQEYVDVGIECSGSNQAELATQELLKDWEAAYAAVGLTEDDHFVEARAAAARLGTTITISSDGIGRHLKKYMPEILSHIKIKRTTTGWHYPKDNSDVENMPEPGAIVVLFYEGDEGQTVGPVISTPIAADPTGQPEYMRTIRWHAIPEE
jgi:hypothetical protein